LKDQTNATAANFSEVFWRSLEKVFSLEPNYALLDFPVGGKKPQQSPGKRTFPRAGFPKYTENFSRRDIKIDTLERRADFACAGGIGDVQILNFKNGRHAMNRGGETSRPLSMVCEGWASGQQGRTFWRRKDNDE
jgi:hypothetical protein